MTALNFERIQFEITNRLHGILSNFEAEHMLGERCLNAIKLCSIDKAELFREINLSKPNSVPHIIQLDQVVNALNTTGVMDLVYICINAQTKEENE